MNNHDYYINDFKQSKKNLNSNKNQTQQTLKYQEDELSSKQNLQNLYSYNSEVNYFKKNLSNNNLNVHQRETWLTEILLSKGTQGS